MNIINRHTSPNGRVLSILEEFQRKYRHLPEEALWAAAGELGLPLSQLYGVATFYTSFSLQPRGDHTIGVCHGTVCHVKGVGRVTSELEKILGIALGETTADGRYTLEPVKCLGCCSLAPVASIDGEVQARLSPEAVVNLLKPAAPGGECDE
ncbi:MAG: NADH-quinone oxidoreductase subunit NuoE [Bacillota bacterium]